MSAERSYTRSSDIPTEVPATRTGLMVGLAMVAGALAASLLLPSWLPGLSESLLAREPKAYWYLSRASGLVAFALVWLSMIWGLLITSRVAIRWPGAASAGELHQHISLLGLGFGGFHALILLGDRYADYGLTQLLIPFTTTAYRPLWVGLGQVGFYLLAIVILSFYVRRLPGRRTWRALHVLSFGVYIAALAHGVMSGTDTSVPWIRAGYWISAAILLFLTIYRILVVRFTAARGPSRSAAS